MWKLLNYTTGMTFNVAVSFLLKSMPKNITEAQTGAWEKKNIMPSAYLWGNGDLHYFSPLRQDLI